jgi:methyl-accepting chemotaxis protein
VVDIGCGRHGRRQAMVSLGILPRIMIPITALVAVAMSGTAWMTASLVSHRLEGDAEAHLAVSADGQAQHLADWIAMARRELLTWSHDPLIAQAVLANAAAAVRQQASERLAQLKRDNDDYDAIHIVDGSGIVIASTAAGSVGTLQVGERPYIQEALAGQDSLSDGFPSKRTGRPVIALATPMRSGGMVVGALYAIVDLGVFAQDIIANGHLGREGSSQLFDSTGTCIAHPQIASRTDRHCARRPAARCATRRTAKPSSPPCARWWGRIGCSAMRRRSPKSGRPTPISCWSSWGWRGARWSWSPW